MNFWRLSHGVGLPSQAWLNANARAIALAAAGVSERTHDLLQERYGADLNRLIVNDPFRLHADLDAFSFASAAFLYHRSTTRNPDLLARACIYKAIRDLTASGSVHFDRRYALKTAESLAALEPQALSRAWDEMLSRGEVVERVLDGVPRGALSRHAREEHDISDAIFTRRGADCVADPDDDVLAARLAAAGCLVRDANQIAAVRQALASRLSLITGGPGTGKTSILSTLAAIHAERRPRHSIMCVSLAARVARAIHDRTGLPADTVHKFLDSRTNGFGHDEHNPAKTDFLIVEEAFMLDNSLIAALLRALKPEARILFVGDAGQLEPIGRGMPLQTIYRHGLLPTVRLSSNHRAGDRSAIAMSGERALRGLMPMTGGDLDLVKTASSPETLTAVVAAYRRAVEIAGEDRVQILAATQHGVGGAKAINNAITGRAGYAVNDRVMCLKNDRSADVFNGELGRVVDIAAHGMSVVTDAGSVVEYQTKDPANLAKAMCITVHKSQGLEFPVVISVLHPSGRRLMTRNLVNVAITRARNKCVIVDQGNQLAAALAKANPPPRLTFIPSIIEQRKRTAP